MTKAVHVIDQGATAAVALHPIRLRILAELAEPDSAAGLARRMGMPRQQVNYHIRQLEEHGLVAAIGERRVRNCIERIIQAAGASFMINPSMLGKLAADPDSIADEASAAYSVAVLSQMIQQFATSVDKSESTSGNRATLTLRREVQFKSPKARESFSAELSEELARLMAKYHAPGSAKGPRVRFMASACSV